MPHALYTIGHSNVTREHLHSLLAQHGIRTVVDVRSQPYSRFNPQFNRPELARTLRQQGMCYLFLGRELGARSEDPECYRNGRALYARIACTAPFADGIRKVEQAIKNDRAALLCAEKEPLSCHRTILIGRHLYERGIPVMHILEDGTVEEHAAALRRPLTELHLPEVDLFRTREEIIASAYEMQAERIQFGEPSPARTSTKEL